MSNWNPLIQFPAKCGKCGIEFTFENAGGSKMKTKLTEEGMTMKLNHYCKDCWEIVKPKVNENKTKEIIKEE